MASTPPSTTAGTAPADLILRGGTVWTLDENRPEAEAVAVRGSRIARVGTDAEVLRLSGPGTRVIDLGGALALPGFIDAHTHFGNAVEAFFTVRVIDVNDQETLGARLREATRRVPAGMWITGSDLSGSAAAARRSAPTPARAAAVSTPAHSARVPVSFHFRHGFRAVADTGHGEPGRGPKVRNLPEPPA